MTITNNRVSLMWQLPITGWVCKFCGLLAEGLHVVVLLACFLCHLCVLLLFCFLGHLCVVCLFSGAISVLLFVFWTICVLFVWSSGVIEGLWHLPLAHEYLVELLMYTVFIWDRWYLNQPQHGRIWLLPCVLLYMAQEKLAKWYQQGFN